MTISKIKKELSAIKRRQPRIVPTELAGLTDDLKPGDYQRLVTFLWFYKLVPNAKSITEWREINGFETVHETFDPEKGDRIMRAIRRKLDGKE